MKNKNKVWPVVFDNGGESFDRYTICYLPEESKGEKRYDYIGAGASQLFSHGELEDNPRHLCRLGEECHLGTRIRFSELPKTIQLQFVQNIQYLDKMNETSMLDDYPHLKDLLT